MLSESSFNRNLAQKLWTAAPQSGYVKATLHEARSWSFSAAVLDFFSGGPKVIDVDSEF
jgi:hypothetical protein